jgi:hypothetical protein
LARNKPSKKCIPGFSLFEKIDVGIIVYIKPDPVIFINSAYYMVMSPAQFRTHCVTNQKGQVKLTHIAQIASFTCVFLVYIMVSLRRRFSAYESMGDLFRKTESEILETTLTERLWGLFVELQHSILQVMSISFDDLIQMMLCNDQVEERMISISIF